MFRLRLLEAKEKLNSKGKIKFLIPVSVLFEELKDKYYKRKGEELGLQTELADGIPSSRTFRRQVDVLERLRDRKK